jgi:hypothetical protein
MLADAVSEPLGGNEPVEPMSPPVSHLTDLTAISHCADASVSSILS